MNLPIRRHPVKRKEMHVSLLEGRMAMTQWEVISVFSLDFSLLKISPSTGRTHQIRVHMAYMGYPVVGDRVYGYGKRWWKQQSSIVEDALTLAKRQMLHAEGLGFIHPDSKKYCEFHAPMPEDMTHIINMMKLVCR